MSKLELVCVFLCLALACSSDAPNEVVDSTLNDVSPGFNEELDEQGETLDDEMDNQENILTQLLGDYDKVKALSEGSDCRCKCVVRPLSRSACQRIEEGNAKTQDFYTVETITSGPDCKCACIAPPSALNPCEGDFRFKKLQEAGKDDVKLSTIMDLLEGAFYGMDLLKLHSVTTKLLDRVEIIEKAVSKNHTEQRVTVRGSSQEQVQVKESRSRTRTEKRKRVPATPLQRDAAAVYMDTEKTYEERFIGPQGQTRPLLKRSQPEEDAERAAEGQAKASPNGKIVRGVTYYKANALEDEDADEHLVAAAEEVVSGDGLVDLLVGDQLLKHKHKSSRANERARPEADQPTASAGTEMVPPTQKYTTTFEEMVAAEGAAEKTPGTTEPPTTTAAIPPMMVATAMTTTTTAPPATPALLTTSASTTTQASTSTKAAGQSVTAKPKYRISWTESPTEDTMEVEPTKNPGMCKDTLATISEPVTHNSYGRSEGAWMKDPKRDDNRIYVANYFYGNILLEYRDLDTFKQGQTSNSYKLPYNWIGTGHVVYNGAFFYNRAFSRDIIKFDLRLRYVAAWTMLHDAAYEEDAPWRWRGHSDIDFAVDESGLWLIYPAVDEESFHREVVVLSKLNPNDLSTHKETSWRTGLRRDYYGNCFVVCGVLYAIDSHERANASLSYAFDTYTNTQMVPRLPFANAHGHSTQIDYNPKERVLYAWDNGHQVTYNVTFAY
ncbi:hypothetical protein MATL_G00243800 [Megalops atlanticus]|uniref:Olfactomedin-like domain-containing protein n=1 Tax=Megalops atlanticus TaxID=7932 RepID=A0A9D3SXP2_MEGAT|nr:hypothetical protein MATL_G00243800 [Megalops atlanticus]